jgi:hypothetical protein
MELNGIGFNPEKLPRRAGYLPEKQGAKNHNQCNNDINRCKDSRGIVKIGTISAVMTVVVMPMMVVCVVVCVVVVVI